jgi:hypothetical protein
MFEDGVEFLFLVLLDLYFSIQISWNQILNLEVNSPHDQIDPTIPQQNLCLNKFHFHSVSSFFNANCLQVSNPQLQPKNLYHMCSSFLHF